MLHDGSCVDSVHIQTFSSSSGMHPGSERAEAAQTMLCTDHDPQKILPSGVRLHGDTAGIADLWQIEIHFVAK